MAQTAVHIPFHLDRAEPPVSVYRRVAVQPQPRDTECLLAQVFGAGIVACHLDRPNDRYGAREAHASDRSVFRPQCSHCRDGASVLLLRRGSSLEAEIQDRLCKMQTVSEKLHLVLACLRCSGKFLDTTALDAETNSYKDRTLDRLIHIASGSTHFDYDWTPCKIHLSVPLMWDILQLNCNPGTHDTSGSSLLHSSLVPSISREDDGDGNPTSTLEIIVATSPEVTVNTADGGQAAHMPPNMPKMSASPPSPGNIVLGDKVVAPADSLMFNTPWLWTDPGQFSDMENMEFQEPDSTIGNVDGFSTWWDFGIL